MSKRLLGKPELPVFKNRDLLKMFAWSQHNALQQAPVPFRGANPDCAAICQALFTSVGEEKLLALQAEILNQLLRLWIDPPILKFFRKLGIDLGALGRI